MTTRTITAMFDNYSDAREAVNRLEAAGIAHDRISIVSNDEAHAQYRDRDDASGAGTGATLGSLIGGGAGLLAGLGLLAIPGLGPVVAAGWLASTALGAGLGAAAGGLVGALTDAGVDETDAHAYAEGVRRGGTLVTVRADETEAARAEDILDDDGTVDMDERTESWRSEGWTGSFGDNDTSRAAAGSLGSTTAQSTSFGAAGTGMGAGSGTATGTGAGTRSGMSTGMGSGTSSGMGSTTRSASGDEVIPVVEEDLHVGKREVSGGRVRVKSYVTETPVSEQVSLRKEHVDVERRPVNRPLSDADRAFQDRTIEAEERSEEAVISKDARVVEEVALSKHAENETRTVSDTVRKTEVEVEDDRSLSGGSKTGRSI
jgi:uncharacterized protein (TIGR02271 family)